MLKAFYNVPILLFFLPQFLHLESSHFVQREIRSKNDAPYYWIWFALAIAPKVFMNTFKAMIIYCPIVVANDVPGE
ncbi:MAG TPA: hypothetical protein VFC84_01430 [Desulfosporosinus sp.]|nr:hypothetical protein [Desulfosporosinus sp.]